jgi:hypothetical protein
MSEPGKALRLAAGAAREAYTAARASHSREELAELVRSSAPLPHSREPAEQ